MKPNRQEANFRIYQKTVSQKTSAAAVPPSPLAQVAFSTLEAVQAIRSLMQQVFGSFTKSKSPQNAKDRESSDAGASTNAAPGRSTAVRTATCPGTDVILLPHE